MAVLVSRIMTTPEAGLGVVTAVEQAEPQAAEQLGEQSLVTADDAPAPATIPPLTTASEDLPAAEQSAAPPADSLAAPVSESTAENPTADDLPAVDGSGADAEPTGDGG